MIVGGYKLNGYNATYERTNFDVRYGKNAEEKCVLEVTDINSGITFIFEHDPRINKRTRQKTRSWHSEK